MGGSGNPKEIRGSQKALGEQNKSVLQMVGGSQENLRGLGGIWSPREGFGRTMFFGGQSQGDLEVFEWPRGVFCGSWGYFVGLGEEVECPRGILGIPGGLSGLAGSRGRRMRPRRGERGSRGSRPGPRPCNAHAPRRALPGPPPAHAPSSLRASRGAAAFARCVLTPRAAANHRSRSPCVMTSQRGGI